MTHEIVETQAACPSCGKMLSGATNIDGKQHAPNPGDLSICGYCGQMLTFDDSRRPRALTQQEFLELPDEKALFMIRAQKLILTRKHQNN